MNKDEIMNQLDNIFFAKRQKSSIEHGNRVREVCEKHPDIADLLSKRSDLIFSSLKTLNNSDKNIDYVDATEKYNTQIENLLEKYAYPKDYLEPKFECDICEDEGKLYTPNLKLCKCYIDEYNKLINKSLDKSFASDETFDTFREDILSNDKIEGQTYSQKENAIKIKKTLEKYCAQFPDNKSPNNLLLIGNSGLGKTFMINAIINELKKKTNDIKYCSAYNWFNIAKKSYFGESIDDYNELLNCKLLVIDDLGTEPFVENITIPLLFNVINERMISNLYTIISTNFSFNDLKRRYTERITSRFNDSRYYAKLTFYGDDLRRRIKK